MHNVKYILMGIVTTFFGLIFALSVLVTGTAFYNWLIYKQGWRDLCLGIVYVLAATVIIAITACVIYYLGKFFRWIGRMVILSGANSYDYGKYMEAEHAAEQRKLRKQYAKAA